MLNKLLKSEIEPSSPVLDDPENELAIAKSQPQYRTLPAIIVDQTSDTILTRWKFPLHHRLRLLITGNLYLEIMRFGNPVQPLYLYTEVRWLQKVSDYFKELSQKYKSIN